ncbi:MAG: metallophosphoesterase [Desulfobulbaceae bacterium]|nr:metallophosphoesterase [Desulfobulbaceae bacterium]
MNRRAFLKFALYSGAVALVGSYPVFIERNIVRVNRYRIALTDLPPSFRGFTLAHLTDLHLGPLVSPSFIAGVVWKTNQLGADAIVCTGDYVHGKNTIEEIEKVWPLLSQLKATHGVYTVLGNHDHWADTDRSLYWLERTAQNIRHQCKPIYRGKERILLGGAGDYWEDDLRIDETFSGSGEKECRILLSHNPDSVDTPFDTPLSLVISGHTHGGQVVVPFGGPPILPVINKQYSSGLITTPRTQVFISKGIGWAIYPVRFNCYPEIALLELA